MDLYPFTFRPIFREKIWGGVRLRTVLGRDLPSSLRIGESWDLVDRPDIGSVVANGPLAGRPLAELLCEERRRILGEDLFFRYPDRFPLLVKLIDADQVLSVQVHPSDEFARRFEPEPRGKSEAWLILHAERGARIYRGVLPGVEREDFIESLRAGELREILYSFEAKRGDVVFIPPGTVHTAGPGLLALEIQQNSDLTYRLHDWDRTDPDGRPRELHLEKGLSVIDFRTTGQARLKPSRVGGFAGRREVLLRCPAFMLERLTMKRPARVSTGGRRFHLITTVSGAGRLAADAADAAEGAEAVELRQGVTVLVPASVAAYTLEPAPDLQVVRTTIE